MILKRLLIFLCVLTFWTCSQRNYQSQSDSLAIVNQRNITLQDFQEQIEPMKAFQGLDTKSESGKKDVLDDMVFQELVFQEALKEEFYLHNLTVKQAVVDQYLQQKFQAAVEKVNDQKAQDYYEKNKASIDRVRASHILIKADPENKEERAKAKNKIEGIRKEILNGQITFEEAAKKYSEDGTSQSGGDLGYFGRGRMVQAFENTAFSMEQIHDISNPVETEFGYHLIMLTDRQTGYDFHRERILAYLVKKEIEEDINQYKAALLDENQVKVFYDRLPKENKQ
ncbi:MAG: peptidylprolyl isomerase [Bdellovibrionales bacterium]|nr:peptidylprolyl isomerase [Bdellovibrionales bacterium]